MFRRSLIVAMVCLGGILTHADAYRALEIARGQTWASPYWGYSTPKVVFDGKAYYTAGMWGATPETAEGVLYKLEEGVWQAGARLPEIYQPATLALDGQGRLIVAYNRSDKPTVLLRSRTPGEIRDLEPLPAPPDMPNAYYIGMALREETLHFAYIVTPTYTMYLTHLDLATLAWSPSVVVMEGQVETKPKTAWTYPILWPEADGLHLVASNAPDGGDGNSYNEVWHLFYPKGSADAAQRERVATCPMGHLAYAMDLLVDREGTVHIVGLFNQRKYGDPLPPGSDEAGLYHFHRAIDDRTWRRERIGPLSLAGLRLDGHRVQVIAQDGGSLNVRAWDSATGTWEAPKTLLGADHYPSPVGFMDVLSPASGSRAHGLVVVNDGVVPAGAERPEEHVLWILLPTPPTS